MLWQRGHSISAYLFRIISTLRLDLDTNCWLDSHFEHSYPLFPRTMFAHVAQGRQGLGQASNGIIVRFKQFNLLNCRIGEYPNYRAISITKTSIH